MGYRSEVALTLKKEDGLELIRQAKENEPVRNFMSCANIIDQNEFITFHWISVMWDGSYEGVRFITRFYQNLEKYSFKRIGDDYNDIEEGWDGDDDSIRYKTQIEIELSIDPPGVLLSTSELLGN